MTAITQQYNVTVQSRYYAFLQDDMESIEPQALLESVERKKEMNRENKSKAKKEKKHKLLSEKKEESKSEEIKEVKTKEMESVPIEKPEEPKNENIDIDSEETRGERMNRGRGSYRRTPRGNRRNFQQKSDDDDNFPRRNNFDRPSRGGRFNNRRELSDGEAENNKVESTEEGLQRPFRGSGGRRGRPTRARGRMPRGNGGGFTGGDDINRGEEFPEKIGTFEDMQESAQIRRPERSRFPRTRSGRGGNRFGRMNDGSEHDNEQGEKMDYFRQDNFRRPMRGGNRGGYRRPMRGMNRRGRGGPYRGENYEKMENQDNMEGMNQAEHPTDVWPNSEDEADLLKQKQDNQQLQLQQNREQERSNETKQDDMVDIRKSNWCEIEDDNPIEGDECTRFDESGVAGGQRTMTLDEWKAVQSQQFSRMALDREIRKANDGRDVFSGMEEYRKETRFNEGGNVNVVGGSVVAGSEHYPSKQKASIPVSIRFGRSGLGSGPDISNVDKDGTKDIVSGPPLRMGGGGGGGPRGGRGGFRGSGRGGYRNNSDFDSRGSGNRGGGRGQIRQQQQQHQIPQQSANSYRRRNELDLNINLGNEEEFPTLS